ncbi:MAG: hypothetical protein OEY01_03605 [Desulfobulbaceae bacterium]|nr:hypothetical protein [Desulfobulbaceae bacterium]
MYSIIDTTIFVNVDFIYIKHFGQGEELHERICHIMVRPCCASV